MPSLSMGSVFVERKERPKKFAALKMSAIEAESSDGIEQRKNPVLSASVGKRGSMLRRKSAKRVLRAVSTLTTSQQALLRKMQEEG